MSAFRDWRRWDAPLFCAALALALVSAVAMVSAAATLNPRLALRHDCWILIGILLSWAVSQTAYHRWTDAAWAAYAASLTALLLVPLAGAMRLGATRWLSIFGLSVQPSELAKAATIWLLARYFAGQPNPLPPRAVWISLAIAVPPALLIFAQPDLGSASVLGAIWLGMAWCAGMTPRMLAGLGVSVLLLSPAAWHSLKAFQRDRLLAFLNPHADPLGAGFSVIQSTIAIGSGRLWGRGWFAGTQNQLNFLPERHSDFIFSVIGEEWGFAGCLALIVLYGLLLVRIARIGLRASDPQGQLLAGGVFSWLAYQACVNLGMVSGLLPVVGVPLPLMSYGGSSMVVVWVALGLIQSVHRGTE